MSVVIENGMMDDGVKRVTTCMYVSGYRKCVKGYHMYVCQWL